MTQPTASTGWAVWLVMQVLLIRTSVKTTVIFRIDSQQQKVKARRRDKIANKPKKNRKTKHVTHMLN